MASNVYEVIQEVMFSKPFKKQPDSYFSGKFHHLGLEWWKFDIWSSEFQKLIAEQFSKLSREDLLDFIPQYVMRMADINKPRGEAVYKLLEVAFGPQIETKKE